MPEDRVFSLSWDNNSNVTGVTPPGQPEHRFTYNAVDLAESYTPPDLDEYAGLETTSAIYNLDRQVEVVSRPDDSTITYVYEEEPNTGRILRVETAEGNIFPTYNPDTGQVDRVLGFDESWIDFEYGAFLVTGFSWGGGAVTGTVDFDYDDLLRLSETSINGAHNVCFEYDNDSLLQGVGHSVEGSCTIDFTIDLHDGETDETNSGLIDETSFGVVTTRLGYNEYAEVDEMLVVVDASPVLSFDYEYDALGRITRIEETGGDSSAASPTASSATTWAVSEWSSTPASTPSVNALSRVRTTIRGAISCPVPSSLTASSEFLSVMREVCTILIPVWFGSAIATTIPGSGVGSLKTPSASGADSTSMPTSATIQSTTSIRVGLLLTSSSTLTQSARASPACSRTIAKASGASSAGSGSTLSAQSCRSYRRHELRDMQGGSAKAWPTLSGLVGGLMMRFMPGGQQAAAGHESSSIPRNAPQGELRREKQVWADTEPEKHSQTYHSGRALKLPPVLEV